MIGDEILGFRKEERRVEERRREERALRVAMARVSSETDLGFWEGYLLPRV